MKRYFLSTKKVKEWFRRHRPGEVLLAKLEGDNMLEIDAEDNGEPNTVYFEVDGDNYVGDRLVEEIEVEMIDDLTFSFVVVKERDEEEDVVRVMRQPEKGAWIEERDL